MSSFTVPAAVRGPWFRARPAAATAVAAALFAGVFALRVAGGTAADVTSMLYVLPVALLAVAFGVRTGLAAGAAAVALIGIWSAVERVTFTPLGWVARVVPLLLLGYLLGDASDRLRRVEAERRALEAAAQRHRDAVEINDTVVQGMTAAKWALELGNTAAGLRALEDTIRLSRQLVSDLLKDADMSPTGPRTADPRFSRASNRAMPD